MADLGQNIRNMVMKGMEAIGNTANSIASNTKQKVDFYNLQGEKKELLNSIGSKIIELWKQGEKLPDALIEDIEKVILIYSPGHKQSLHVQLDIPLHDPNREHP